MPRKHPSPQLSPDLIEFDNASYLTGGLSRSHILPNQMVLEFDPPLKVEIMKAVIQKFAYTHKDLFKTVLEHQGKWYHAPMQEHLFSEVLTLTDKPWDHSFCQELDADKDPLHRFILCKKGSYLIQQIAHSTADGYSMKMILAAIMQAYLALVNGQPVSFPSFRFGLMKDHYAQTRFDTHGNRVRKLPLAVRGVWKYMREKKLTRTAFSEHGKRPLRYQEEILPDQIFTLLSHVRKIEPEVTLHDVLVTLLLHTYMDMEQEKRVRYILSNNVRREDERYKVGNILSSLNMRIARFRGIKLENIIQVCKDRILYQKTPLSYEVVATYMIRPFNLASYAKLFHQYHSVPYCHLIISNMGSFPPKAFPDFRQLASQINLTDWRAWGYQMGGLNTLVIFQKSPQGQKICFVSKADASYIQGLIDHMKYKLSAYVKLSERG